MAKNEAGGAGGGAPADEIRISGPAGRADPERVIAYCVGVSIN